MTYKAHHFVKGDLESSRTLSHFLVHTVFSAILAQYSSGLANDSRCSDRYLSPGRSRPAMKLASYIMAIDITFAVLVRCSFCRFLL